MELKTTCEFRGCSSRKDDKGNIYNYVNFEDEKGEASKFSVDSNYLFDSKQFKKGDKCNVTFDLSVKYGSLKVINIVKV